MIAIELPKIQYTTISYARLMSVDMPFAEPHRGAPFGHKNGPALALVGPALAIKSGIALGISTLAGGLMIASGALGLIGGLTGNKTLSTIGMVGGLAGGFISPEGAFMNPFAEGAGNSVLEETTGSIFDSIKEGLGLGTSTIPSIGPDVAGYTIDGGEILANAGGTFTDGVADAIGSVGASDVTSSSGAAATAGEAAKGKGLIGKLGGAASIYGAVSGAAKAYQEQPLIDAQVGRLDAITDKYNQEIELAQQRMDNKQFQNTGNILQVNENADVYNTGSQTATPAGRYAIVDGNTVRYVSAAEYQAFQAAKNRQQTQMAQGTGLINQGAVA